MTPLRILVDVDGVVADLVSRLCQFPGLRHLTPEHCTTPKFSDDPNLTDLEKKLLAGAMEMRGAVRDLPLHDGARDMVRRFRDNAHEVVFLTHHYETSQTWVYDRSQWLAEHFPGIPVIYTKHKELVPGDALVEDTPINLERWLYANKTRGHGPVRGFLVRRPWNRSYNFPPAHRMLFPVNELSEVADFYGVP
jgi:5'(3')-deoxyribonucleotidase